MTRYRLTELTPSGASRRLITERLAVARDVIDALGGEWRFERQYRWGGDWHRDGGRAVWTESAASDMTLVRTGSGGVLADGTTNHPAIDFDADPAAAAITGLRR